MSHTSLDDRARAAAAAVRSQVALPVAAPLHLDADRRPRRRGAVLVAAGLAALALVVGAVIRSEGTTRRTAASSMTMPLLDEYFTEGTIGGTSVALGEGHVWIAGGGWTEEREGLTYAGTTLARVDPTSGEQHAARLGEGLGHGLAVAAGSVWITGGGDGAVPGGVILRVDPATLEIEHRWSVTASPWDVVEGSGAIWIADIGGKSLLRIDPETNELTRRALGEELRPAEIGPIELLVASGQVVVHVRGEAGTQLLHLGPDGVLEEFYSSARTDDVVASDGRAIYVAHRLACPREIDECATWLMKAEIIDGHFERPRELEKVSHPHAMLATPRAVWLLSAGTPDRSNIRRYDVATNRTPGPLVLPVGIGEPWYGSEWTTDADGTIWFLDRARGRLLHLADPGDDAGG
jgi:streptogramin lyase